MEIRSFVHGVAGANMYVLLFGKKALVIDPCCPWEKTDLPSDIAVTAVFCTHGHFDHISSADDIVSRFSCPLYISKEDKDMLPDPDLNHASSFGLHVSVQSASVQWVNDEITSKELGIEDSEAFSLKIIPTPGHTSGSVCYLFLPQNESIEYMFTGDMLFRGSIGRTDLGGSEKQMKESIALLKKMDDAIRCYPGHGPSTILGKEKLYNPFFFI